MGETKKSREGGKPFGVLSYAMLLGNVAGNSIMFKMTNVFGNIDVIGGSLIFA